MRLRRKRAVALAAIWISVGLGVLVPPITLHKDALRDAITQYLSWIAITLTLLDWHTNTDIRVRQEEP